MVPILIMRSPCCAAGSLSATQLPHQPPPSAVIPQPPAPLPVEPQGGIGYCLARTHGSHRHGNSVLAPRIPHMLTVMIQSA